jgi:hypothetical protein
MPNNREHNKICEQQRYDRNLCKRINKWMDKPASEFPGCQHRNFRHSKDDCDFVGREILDKSGNINKAREAKQICMLHRVVDRRADKGCGCKPLFEDY